MFGVSTSRFLIGTRSSLFLSCCRAVAQKQTLSTSSSKMAELKNITVVGSGLMGTGIAQASKFIRIKKLMITEGCISFPLQVSANNGYNVTLVDLNDELLQRASKRIESSIQRVAKKSFPEDEQVSNSSEGGVVFYLCHLLVLRLKRI